MHTYTEAGAKRKGKGAVLAVPKPQEEARCTHMCVYIYI